MQLAAPSVRLFGIRLDLVPYQAHAPQKVPHGTRAPAQVFGDVFRESRV